MWCRNPGPRQISEEKPTEKREAHCGNRKFWVQARMAKGFWGFKASTGTWVRAVRQKGYSVTCGAPKVHRLARVELTSRNCHDEEFYQRTRNQTLRPLSQNCGKGKDLSRVEGSRRPRQPQAIQGLEHIRLLCKVTESQRSQEEQIATDD